MLTVFEIVDISMLAVLLVILIFFLYKNKKNLKKEGVLFLYKTKWGMKLIDKIGKKYDKTLHFFSYVSIVVGYILMVGIFYLLGNAIYSYLTNPAIVQIIRAPPIAPLIPYFPRIFGVSEFFPPLYALYFIISILIVATAHEFAHGIFAKKWGVRIKSTGFAFFKYFPAIFGAFVEQDDKEMREKSSFKQMSILSAGVFVNIIMAVLFFIILIGFFYLSFSAIGPSFNSYTYSFVAISGISLVNNVSLENPSMENVLENIKNINESTYINIIAEDKSYLITKDLLNSQSENEEFVILYHDAPAINTGLEGIIKKINNVEIKDYEDLGNELGKYSPGEEVTITTIVDNKEKEYEIVLEKHPEDATKGYLGIGFVKERGFVIKHAEHFLSSFKPKNVYVLGNVYYEPNFRVAVFLYYLIWWIILINLLVALFNMLPLGILDGGRFFYLTIRGITRSKKIAKIFSAGLTYIILIAFSLLMVRWLMSFIF